MWAIINGRSVRYLKSTAFLKTGQVLISPITKLEEQQDSVITEENEPEVAPTEPLAIKKARPSAYQPSPHNTSSKLAKKLTPGT